MVLPTTDEGLTAAQAAQRLLDDGPNALPGDQRRQLRAIVKETVQEPMFMLLLVAGSLYLVFGDLQEGLVLFGFVLVVLALTLYQEGKTETSPARALWCCARAKPCALPALTWLWAIF